jgi:hypothetical protein
VKTIARLVLAAVVASCAVAGPSRPAGAADVTIEVDTLDDVVDANDGLTSFREAVDEASGELGEVEITLPAGLYVLDRCHANPGEDDDGNDLGDADFAAAGATSLVINGPGAHVHQDCTGNRVLHGLAEASISMIGVRFSGGKDVPGSGGAVWAPMAHVLLAEGASIVDSSATGDGGAVAAAIVTVLDAGLAHNDAVGAGGAVHSSGVMTLDGSTFVGNESFTGRGGAAFAGGAVVVAHSTFVENVSNAFVGDELGGAIAAAAIDSSWSRYENNATAGLGGALAADAVTSESDVFAGNGALGGGAISSTGDAAVVGSTFEENVAFLGGAIHALDAIESTGSTFSRNRASGGGAVRASSFVARNTTLSGNEAITGGGAVIAGSADLTHVTLVDNVVAELMGSGAHLLIEAGGLTARATVISGSPDTACHFDGGAVVSHGANVDGGTTCGFDHATDLHDVADPKLAPLADNGGPTATHLPAVDSPLVDLVPAADCTLADDQRGITRPQGDGCDAGAVEREVQALPPEATFEASAVPACSGDDRVAEVTVTSSGAGDLHLDVVVDGIVVIDAGFVPDGQPTTFDASLEPDGAGTVRLVDGDSEQVLFEEQVVSGACTSADPAAPVGGSPSFTG